MRTAEEIRSDFKKDDILQLDDLTRLEFFSDYKIYEMINKARKEAIEECAERAKIGYVTVLRPRDTTVLDKESILSLIKELK